MEKEIPFKTVAVFDLETTGLPHLEFNQTKITQLCILACSVEHILEIADKNELPRVSHSLSLCFNPYKRISLESSKITGFTNELLENENKFDNNTFDLLINFLNQLQQPVCLIAHNGNKFDFPIFKKYCTTFNRTLPGSLMTVDSLPIFRKIDEIYQEHARLLINGHLMKSWEKLKEEEVFAINTEILEINEIIKTQEWDDENSTVTIEQLENEFVNADHVKKEIDDNRTRQVINETTPSKTTKQINLNPNAKSFNGNKKRPSSSLRRELFASDDEPISSTSSNSGPADSTTPSNKKWPKGKYTLREIYKRHFNKYPENSHDASSDVKALLSCICAVNKQFLETSATMSKRFCDF